MGHPPAAVRPYGGSAVRDERQRELDDIPIGVLGVGSELIEARDAVGDYPIDKCTQQALREVRVIEQGLDDVAIRALERHCVSNDDRRRECGRSPVRGHVDDQRREVVVEQHVPSEIAVHQLRPTPD